MQAYSEEDWLPLAGLQHFAFCPRQFALIHMEQQWAENARTMEGRLLHERAHNALLTEKRGGLLVSRGMMVFSPQLGVLGVCDVVEFHRDDTGVPLRGREGRWRPVPVEYKRGKPKKEETDVSQLCAQALCLEHMLACHIPEAYLYYGEPARRTKVILDPALRERVQELAARMHACYDRGTTPRPKLAKRCRLCSLANICLPELTKTPDVARYLRDRLQEEELE